MMCQLSVGYGGKATIVNLWWAVASPGSFDMEHHENLHPSVAIQIHYSDKHTFPSTKNLLEGIRCLNSPIFSSAKRPQLANLFLLGSRACCIW